jgi:hypothetical protein
MNKRKGGIENFWKKGLLDGQQKQKNFIHHSKESEQKLGDELIGLTRYADSIFPAPYVGTCCICATTFLGGTCLYDAILFGSVQSKLKIAVLRGTLFGGIQIALSVF